MTATNNSSSTEFKVKRKRLKKSGLTVPSKKVSKHDLPGHTHNPLASYCYFPDHARFVNQDPDEKVILLLRKHPITNVGWILVAFFLIIIPAFFPILPFFEQLPGGLQIVSYLIWYLITSAFVFENFLSWYFHVNIITDERIIEVDFIHLVYREITDANIDQIQDVTVEIGSALRTVFNYGDILIQTAAQIPKIDLDSVPQPDKVAQVLRSLRIEEEIEKLEGRRR